MGSCAIIISDVYASFPRIHQILRVNCCLGVLTNRCPKNLGVPRIFGISILCLQASNLKKFPIEVSYSIRVLKTEILKSSVDLPTSGLQILWLSVINFVKIIFRFWLRLSIRYICLKVNNYSCSVSLEILTQTHFLRRNFTI